MSAAGYLSLEFTSAQFACRCRVVRRELGNAAAVPELPDLGDEETNRPGVGKILHVGGDGLPFGRSEGFLH